jgi:pyruvate dehydrogenase E2 component (dihydrolipoamide acetyltransferase)
MSAFALPDLGEGLQEAEIVAWHVSAGDHVVPDQPLVSVETEKAVVEVPSPRAGRVARLCAAVGDRVPVGGALVEFEDAAHPDSGTVVGALEPGAPATAVPAAPPPPAATGRALPAARRLAARLGLDLARIAPTGPGGAVTVADVEAAARATGPGGGSQPAAEPLQGVRRAMAQAMARSGAEVVPATVADDADVEAWATPEADVTVRLIRAVAAGCAAAPALNAWYDGAAMSRRLHRRVDLGLAVDSADGLFAPVIRDAGGRDAAGLRREIDRLKAAVAARQLALAELRDPSITLSNVGTLAGRYLALVVVPPQVAILGAGRIRPRVVAAGGQAAVRRLLPLSLTFDHRAASGGEAARFLAAAIADLERPC